MTRSARDRVNAHLADSQSESNAPPTATQPADTGRPLRPPPPKTLVRENMSPGVANPVQPRVTFSIELDAPRKRAPEKSPTTPAQGTHRYAGLKPESPPPSLAPTEAASEGPIVLTRKQYQLMVSWGMLGQGAGPAPSGSSSPLLHRNQHPKARTNPPKRQYTYEYETLNHEGLVNYARQEFGLYVEDCDTQTIIDQLRLAEAEQAAPNGASRRPPSIVVPPPSRIELGGGWSQNLVSSQPSDASKKRSRTPLDSSGTSSKRQCREIVVHDTETETETDTATESESESESELSPRTIAERLLSACPDSTVNLDPTTRPPQRGTRAPPPSRDSTPSTVIETPAANGFSPSLGGSIPPRTRKLPNLSAPTSGPVHARLRTEILTRYLGEVGSQARTTAANEPVDGSQSNVNEVPETDFGSSPQTSQRATHESVGSSNTSQRATRGSSSPLTYAGYRSHLPTQPELERSATEPASNDAGPKSPNLTAAELIRRERIRATLAKAQQQPVDKRRRRRRPPLAPTMAAPSSRTQPRPSVGGRGNAVGRREGGPRRSDPLSAARQDLLASNRAMARGEATSLADDVRLQSERTARCTPPESRPMDELLDDQEEAYAKAEALKNGKWPHRARPARKPKPLARDVSGIERQVLIMAKLHLFAYALVEGIYQTRTTFLLWAKAVYYATWQMEVPDRPYQEPDQAILEIMVNNIATLRGKVKERMREFVATVSGFKHNMLKQSEILKNIAIFNKLYPTGFICKSTNPPRDEYEHREIGHAIGLACFHGPNSVGVMYPDYFRDMPLTVVAFVLAMWQFCLEEWSNGWRQFGDLGMASMREKYESQLAGLKELRRVAPKRANRLQNEWRDFAAQYSGAVFDPEPENGEPELQGQSRIRPDTPDMDDAISVEEMEARLAETARQESIQGYLRELAARELENDMEIDENEDENEEGSRSSTPCPRPPSSPPVEFNEYGVQTARSKGKGRAK
ncbi:unnamed protein product [Rhizoctonia solani]|uniref:DUF6532 domain-containing protein n=1 Tax=Rhizoctonia solani TaxID=456999 RepID=A0A8H3DWN4_9AGAM|nr:unnamed protein product [Rhizoctonia solani]